MTHKIIKKHLLTMICL